ncbi:response regulator receiver domain-containing protein [Roseivivax marinus]|jgi:CheY-like chemotaxis protein|uniref:Response regulator receiver domain-containing protein n=1 Tax=Roseivivax marinus TaxID=1379903 RepID=W4HLP3_9RHOB|nr:response regulator [Roseivivax marinus]ETW13692.1 response regulator receiver domain-containing protein [Roseivivax marinus]SEK51350.1 Response regulator receiver domain-containing protein [Roseivivax marinus]
MNLKPKSDPTGPRRVLVCEDEPVVALDLKFLVEGFGYEVIGPYGSVEQALEAIDAVRPDSAVLDVRLRDGEVFPVADKLKDLGIGMVFHSGHAYEEEICANYPGSACCQKPIVTWRLEEELKRLTTEPHPV